MSEAWWILEIKLEILTSVHQTTGTDSEYTELSFSHRPTGLESHSSAIRLKRFQLGSSVPAVRAHSAVSWAWQMQVCLSVAMSPVAQN